MKPLIRIGTRGSKLALFQANALEIKLKERFPKLEFRVVRIQTRGDRFQRGAVGSSAGWALDRTVPLDRAAVGRLEQRYRTVGSVPRDRRGAIGSIGTNVFTREIEDALLRGEVNVAVHSAKDLASELPAGLRIGAFLERDDRRDCLVARDGACFASLQKGARIGTSSIRRQAQLRAMRSDLQFVPLRGNVDTRIEKVKRGECEGMVLAFAGLKRLGLESSVTEIFEPDVLLPQAGQGAIAVQIRADDSHIAPIVETINHDTTYQGVMSERAFLRGLQGGCQVPVGVTSTIRGGQLTLHGAIFALEGEQKVMGTETGPVLDFDEIGSRLAHRLFISGGERILKTIQGITNA
ncbi:MAG: hypothetical protein A3A73_00355 [Omnitrophica bacterium RIFCSPLOWO2_01_FULL_50_24]|nr:MAG: hypothetical protein A3A73_00355 [Omnitrophica bacterium RIFCSPLOWO2_01_FULL_50_24]